jgi:hypothetical protein
VRKHHNYVACHFADGDERGRWRKRFSERPGRKYEKADHSASMAETQTGKEENIMVGRQV